MTINQKAFTRTNFADNGSLNGFTLIEMIIVIAVIAVLVLLILLVLNPAEIQKKARDNSRMRDLTNLDGAFTEMTMDKKIENTEGSWFDVSSTVFSHLVEYVNPIPDDPKPNIGYYKAMTANDAYKICVNLEKSAPGSYSSVERSITNSCPTPAP